MYAGHFDFDKPLMWTIERLLDDNDCAAIVERIEALGPEVATINTGRRQGGELMPEVRNNGRVIVDDVALAARLFERVREKVPAEMMGMTLAGANERLRMYRYLPGEYFALHRDGAFVRSEAERSLLTFMIYLNGDFEGGETDFPELKQKIKPTTGMAILFQHMLLHEGCEVLAGKKYAIRSDIMYRSP